MQAKITEAVRLALQGSRKVKITFKRQATGDINYLLGMSNSGIVSLNSGDTIVLMAVAMSADWEHEDNRTLTVTLTDKFDESWFVGRMRRALESIEVVS